jgi:hypothetical protein
LKNLKGEKFDVKQTGNMLMFEVPRGTRDDPDNLNLSVRADIQHYGKAKCGPTFITKIQLAGKWLGKPVEVQSGPLVEPHSKSKNAFGIKMGEIFKTHADFKARNQLKHVGGQKISEEALITTYGNRTFIVKANVLKVVVSQRTRKTQDYLLEIMIKGVGKLGVEVGGLLGLDDHEEEVKPSEVCQKRRLERLDDQDQPWTAAAE